MKVYWQHVRRGENLMLSNEEGQEERSPVLLIIAIISAVSAIGLGIMIVFGKKNE